MISRLQQLLQAENISRTQFADMLGISPATVTHLLTGRNKPSFELIQTISARFPNLNIEWLINGTGKMYKNGQTPLPQDGNPDLFFEKFEGNTLADQKQVADNKQIYPSKKVAKITIFYTDGTFQDIPVK